MDQGPGGIGRPDLHLHDLRHSGLTWSAATGATLAELMHRAGHKSPVAALRYQQATVDRAVADALSKLGRKATVVPLHPEDRLPILEGEPRLPRDGRAMGYRAEPPEPASDAVVVPLTRGNV